MTVIKNKYNNKNKNILQEEGKKKRSSNNYNRKQ